MILIVGLGNPGKKYEKTRHNFGLMVIDELVRNWNVSSQVSKRLSSIIYKEPEKKVILAKPQVLMNASGFAVAKVVNFFKIPLENLWVVHDDLDLPLGRFKIKRGGGTAGHRGLESVVKELGTYDFVRFRLGIGHPGLASADKEIKNYVLTPFKTKEQVKARKMVKRAAKAIKVALEKGLDQAANQFN